MNMKSNVVALPKRITRSDLLKSERVVSKLTIEDSPIFEKMISESRDKKKLSTYFVGYPVFRNACFHLFNLVGPQWRLPGQVSFLLVCIDEVVAYANHYVESLSSSYSQVQTLLLTELAEKLAGLAGYETVRVSDEGVIEYWDLRFKAFQEWACNAQTGDIVLLKKDGDHRMAVFGLRVRFLSMVLDDETLGIALSRRF